MTGVTDLNTLLENMQPVLEEVSYAFLTFPEGSYGDGSHLNPIGMFKEKEGMTLIVPTDEARNNNQNVEAEFRCISLQIHSSLEAVGLTAAISNKLAEAGISANVVAAYFHDHVFVPADKAEQALKVLTVS